MTHETPEAACVGLAGLFEAVDLDSHKLAAAICDGCGFFNHCRTILLDQQRKVAERDGLHGTWAGELWNKGRRIKVRKVRQKIADEMPAIPGSCADCRVPVAGQRLYCEPCRKKARVRSSAAYESTKRLYRYGGVDVPCSACGVGVDVGCVSNTGKRTATHKARLDASSAAIAERRAS